MTKPEQQRNLAGFDDEQPAENAAPAAETELESAETESEGAERGEEIAERNGPPDLTGKSVFVIDAHYLIYQLFHAMPDMTGPSGQPTGAIHGFVRDMLDLLERHQPDYLFCAFDAPGPTFRHEVYAPYKETRDEMPADLKLQIPNVRRFLDAMQIAALDCPGYEADDLLATIARQTEAGGGRCVLVTNDKDCRQLISDSVVMYNIRKDQTIDAAALMELWGVRPDQVVDFQALVGDSSDNVPGVPLIGPKAAKDLLQKYETLDAVLDHADEVSGKKRSENLKKYRDQAYKSQELVRLVNSAPACIDWEAGKISEFDHERVAELCQEFGIRRLAERLRGYEAPQPPAEWTTDYRLIATPEELAELAKELAKQTRISIDTETTAQHPRLAKLVGYSICWKPGEAYYLPVKGPPGEAVLDENLVRETLRPVLEDAGVQKVGQNLKYDMVVLRGDGVHLAGAAFDTMVADYLLAAGERTHNLDDLAQRYLNHQNISIDSLIGSGKKQKRMDEIPVESVAPYACEDADVALRLADVLEPKLEEAGLRDLFRTLEMPLVEVLTDMEFLGVRVDRRRLEELQERFSSRMQSIQQEIYELAGEEFNIDSRLQLAEVLFERLALPILKKTKTGPSMDADVLTQLAAMHDLPAKVVDYRQVAKLLSTYVVALQGLINEETGRVHTSYKQDVAATGRLSSKDPNLQNIPIRTAEGREIRSAFLPAEGWKLITADYSQIELRVLAHFSGDETLRSAFENDIDIHAQVASRVYGAPLDEVTPDMRRSAKTVNFGIVYGQSPFGLAKQLSVEQEEAAAFIEAYFAQYPGVEEFMENLLEECRQKGYVGTALGRRRAVKGVRPPEKRSGSRGRTTAERIAINTVIQGTAADIIKRAMIDIHRRLAREERQTRMLLQIHDELIFEAPPNEVSAVAELVVEEMIGAAELSVPLKVDVKTGDNWAECEAMR